MEVSGTESAQVIRDRIDKWLLNQELDPDQQPKFQRMMLQEISLHAIQLKLDPDSEEFKEIVLECAEMLQMQMTAISLLGEIDEF